MLIEQIYCVLTCANDNILLNLGIVLNMKFFKNGKMPILNIYIVSNFILLLFQIFLRYRYNKFFSKPNNIECLQYIAELVNLIVSRGLVL